MATATTTLPAWLFNSCGSLNQEPPHSITQKSINARILHLCRSQLFVIPYGYRHCLGLYQLLPQVIPTKKINKKDQVAIVYGLGVCTEYGGYVIKPLVGGDLSRLTVVIRYPNVVHPENVMAYDNAISTLGKICHFHHDSIDSGYSCMVKLFANQRSYRSQSCS
ncbi:unnamed protein product [Lactuca saligna]|uniref:Uncharacterized protein n=1 Tax=Lactuca saligna TaxID=75948 RepID=A0AA35VJ20_LACSI|nr:unnamed protein product [Lactuca saligna]